MLKFNGDLYFLKDDRISLGNVNMAKIYERVLSTNILREKGRDSCDPHRVTLLGEDIICIVNLLEIPRVIVFFFFFMTSLTCFILFRKVFFLSSNHENQNVFTIRPPLPQFMLSCQ